MKKRLSRFERNVQALQVASVLPSGLHKAAELLQRDRFVAAACALGTEIISFATAHQMYGTAHVSELLKINPAAGATAAVGAALCCGTAICNFARMIVTGKRASNAQYARDYVLANDNTLTRYAIQLTKKKPPARRPR